MTTQEPLLGVVAVAERTPGAEGLGVCSGDGVVPAMAPVTGLMGRKGTEGLVMATSGMIIGAEGAGLRDPSCAALGMGGVAKDWVVVWTGIAELEPDDGDAMATAPVGLPDGERTTEVTLTRRILFLALVLFGGRSLLGSPTALVLLDRICLLGTLRTGRLGPVRAVRRCEANMARASARCMTSSSSPL